MRQNVVSRQGELRRRALLTTVISFGALATLALVPLAALWRVDQIYAQRSHLEGSLEATARLTASVGEQRRLLLDYGTGHDPDVLEDLRQAGRTSAFAVAQLRADRALAVQGSVIDRVATLVDGAASALEDQLAPAVTSGDVGATNAAFDAADQQLDRVQSATVVLESAVKGQARDVDQALAQVLGRARTSMLFSGAVTLLVMAVVSYTNVRALVSRGEQRFRALVQHGSDMLLTVDRAGLVTYASPSVGTTLGLDADALVGRPFADVVHPDDASRTSDLGAGAPTGVGQHHLRLVAADGSTHHGEVLVSTMADGTVVLTVRDVTERLALEAELRRRAVQDPGTGLANGAALREALAGALASARRSHEAFTVLGVGLDGLREVRTLEGVVRADAALLACARRVEALLGEGGLVARVTDDELVVVVRGCPDEADALAGAVVERLSQPVGVEGGQTGVLAAVGLATSYGDHTPDDLVRDVSLAVGQARAAGGRTWVRFDPSVHDAAREQAELVADLRAAIAGGGLELHYQPIVALGTGRVSGVEALCRWQHPVLGWVPPVRFIPLAEASGDIDALGRWALHESCRQLKRWQAEGRTLTVSVNVAVSQLRDPAFVAEVRSALEAAAVDAHGLVLEITESNLVSEAVLENARALRLLGVGIAIDDFGTGYSSLSYLGRLPVTSLKIDKSFIDRLGDDRPSEELVGTIVELAQSFDLRTVAEGIENEEQAEVLRLLGCQLGQGFRWSRAVPAAAIDDLLAELPRP